MFIKFKVKEEHFKLFSSTLTALEKTLDHSLIMHFMEEVPLAINTKRNDVMFCSLVFKSDVFEIFDNEGMKTASIQNPSHLTKPIRQFKSPEFFTDGVKIVITDVDKTEFSFPLLTSTMAKIERMDFAKIEPQHILFSHTLAFEDTKELLQASDFVSDSDYFQINTKAGSDVINIKIGEESTGVFKKDMKLSSPANQDSEQTFPRSDLTSALRSISSIGKDVSFFSIPGALVFRIEDGLIDFSYGVKRLFDKKAV